MKYLERLERFVPHKRERNAPNPGSSTAGIGSIPGPSTPPTHQVTYPETLYTSHDDPEQRRFSISTSIVSSTASSHTSKPLPGKRYAHLEKLLEQSDDPEIKAMAERIQTFYIQRKDRPGLIRMKLQGEDFPKEKLWGAAFANYLVAAKRYEVNGDAASPPAPNLPCLFVKQAADGTWSATTTNNEPAELPDGKYIFVTMADGTVRISSSAREGGNAHSELSGNAAYVKYAGEVTFENAKVVAGTPQSGTYMPSPYLWEQSGFQCKVTIPEGMDFEEVERIYQEQRVSESIDPSQSAGPSQA